jgi:hypothetical protein
MGAVKLPVRDYTNVANNANYVGGAVKTTSSTVNTTVATVEKSLVSRVSSSSALGVASRVLSRANPYLFFGSLAWDVGSNIYDYFNPDDTTEIVHKIKKPAVSNGSSSNSVVNTNPTPTNDPASTLAYELNKAKEEQQKALEGSLSGVEDGISAPIVETTLPNVMRENTYALVQSLNYFTRTFSNGVGDLVSSLQGLLLQGDAMTQLKQAEYQQRDEHKYIDIQLWKAFLENGAKAFEKYKPTEVDMEFMKPFYEKGAEDYDYKKNPLSLRDLDGQAVATKSPREIEAIKNATVSRKTTDENNLEFDEDDFDIMDSLPDLSGLFAKTNMAKEIEDILMNRV